MIRLLDRYVLGVFLWALGVFTLTFVVLFLVVDFASKLGRFLELKNVAVLPFMAQYYVVRVPMILTYLLPTVVLFGAIFTVIKLARTNEIVPIAASGTSLRRMALPFLMSAVLAAATMAMMDEFVLAGLGDQITETEELLTSREVSHGVEAYDGRMHLWAFKYDRVRKEMYQVRIARMDADARTIETVTADICRWDETRGRWVAFRGEIVKLREWVESPGQRPRVKKMPIPPEGYVVEADFTPKTLRKSASFFTNQLPFAPLSKLLDEARRYPHVPSCAVKVHARFAFPLSPLVLLLLGLPFVVAAHSKSFIKGLIFCFLLALAYYMTHFAALDLGNRGAVPPVVAAWLSTAIFGSLGVVFFSRMRT